MPRNIPLVYEDDETQVVRYYPKNVSLVPQELVGAASNPLVKNAASTLWLSQFGGIATIVSASDYVSTFRGDGCRSAMSLPW